MKRNHEESTNSIKSRNGRKSIILLLSYLSIWVFAIIVFWFFSGGSDALGYSLLFLWILIPLTTLVVSVLIGKNDYFGKGKWPFTLLFGIMYMLAEYCTFSLANNIAFDKVNPPDLEMIAAGAIISAIGMLSGSAIRKYRSSR